ncbi:sterol desaturase family protein [Vibrio maritimus]|uniref:Sterol desaturase family protein n=1 Tax=Vibrio maritimus TaxID=990268 RepID=A0A090T5B9_9VIBR|nr:sterol desaturase family protein [Vibrio maritimus]
MLNLGLQFFVHTQWIHKLGPLEWVFNTPSHHRVHHGVNAQYIDKNYAGVLIIWDRLFGTFEPEVEIVRYGISKPVNSFNLWL